KHGTREDVVFLINGIPVLVIECKNATKDEAIALGVDQVRRYHAETPEMFVPQMVFTATEAIGFSYGVTWNLIRRNIFNWKNEQKGNLWLTTAHVRRYHQHYHSSGHVWQGRFRSFPIQEDDHLLTVHRYIERNPVRAG